MSEVRRIEAEARRSAKAWQKFENAPLAFQQRARLRMQALLENEGDFAQQTKSEWVAKVRGLDKREWLPALVGEGHTALHLFQNRGENLDILDTICGLLTAIDQKIDALWQEDGGDCGYLQDQAAQYFGLAETLRKARTQAEKLNEVTL